MSHTPTEAQIAHYRHEVALAAELAKDVGKDRPHVSYPHVEQRTLASGLIQYRRVLTCGASLWVPDEAIVRGFLGPDAK